MKVKRIGLSICELCGSTNIRLNKAKTKFCLECQHSISRKGNVNRMPGHFLYEEGYEVREGDPDWISSSAEGEA